MKMKVSCVVCLQQTIMIGRCIHSAILDCLKEMQGDSR